MPKPRTEASDPDLYESIQQFGQQIAALTDAVDRLCDELQWRNNERRKDGEHSPPPFVLHSMPVDPTTDDWQLNRVRPEVSAKQAAPADSPHDQRVDRLLREIADLRQYVAAIVLLGACDEEPEFYESYSWLLEWASREFDPEILRLAIPEAILAQFEREPADLAQSSIRQRHLFDEGATDADRSDA